MPHTSTDNGPQANGARFRNWRGFLTDSQRAALEQTAASGLGVAVGSRCDSSSGAGSGAGSDRGRVAIPLLFAGVLLFCLARS